MPGGYKGGTPGPLLEIDTDLKRGHDRPGDCVPASRSARPRWQPTTRLRWLQGLDLNQRPLGYEIVNGRVANPLIF